MKFKLDTNSFRFKCIICFILLAMVFVGLLWTLQAVFLESFYESMKETRTNKALKQIEQAYEDYDTDAFYSEVISATGDKDMFVYITNADGTPFLSCGHKPGPPGTAEKHIQAIDSKLDSTGKQSASLYIDSMKNEHKHLVCGQMLASEGKPAMTVYISSPLWPIEPVLEILIMQLLNITIVAFLCALGPAVFLSYTISKPIRNITRSARRLAAGEYGVTFQGKGYTEITELADTLNRASIELEKSASLQKDLIANVSHDLRTPLTMVKSYAEMVRDISGNNPEKRDAHLQVIIEEADRLNLLVNDMLTLSKMQSGAIEINRTDFNLYEAVESIITTYKLLVEESGYIINFDCPQKLQVNGDPERIKQVFSNLIDNALKFCGKDKTVNVTIKKKSRTAVCQIQDHGAGIAPEDLEHIWERYYKSSSNTVRSKTGSGLGLSIVKEILSLHNVKYGVDSRRDEGTTFHFELPTV